MASLATVGIVFAFTGKIFLSLGVGSAEVLLKVALYYFHERAWERVRWGRPSVKPAVADTVRNVKKKPAEDHERIEGPVVTQDDSW